MSDKVLLREYYALCEGGYCQDLLTEAEKRDMKENNAWYLTGILQKGNTKNGNGRKYPSHVLEREMKNYDMLIKQRIPRYFAREKRIYELWPFNNSVVTGRNNSVTAIASVCGD